MIDQGFESDVFKLAVLSNRQREELMANLKLMPGHRERMLNLFKVIEQLNPRTTVKQTLDRLTGDNDTSLLKNQRVSKDKPNVSKILSDPREAFGGQVVFSGEQTQAYIAMLSEKDTSKSIP
jgi:hypothetical protein